MVVMVLVANGSYISIVHVQLAIPGSSFVFVITNTQKRESVGRGRSYHLHACTGRKKESIVVNLRMVKKGRVVQLLIRILQQTVQFSLKRIRKSICCISSSQNRVVSSEIFGLQCKQMLKLKLEAYFRWLPTKDILYSKVIW